MVKLPPGSNDMKQDKQSTQSKAHKAKHEDTNKVIQIKDYS